MFRVEESQPDDCISYMYQSASLVVEYSNDENEPDRAQAIKALIRADARGAFLPLLDQVCDMSCTKRLCPSELSL